MSGWGIAETAPEIEKIKAESADYLNGLNSCGEVSWEVYDYAFDFYVGLIQKAYELGKLEAKPHWIPVTERLPESKEEDLEYPTVLICFENEEIMLGCFYESTKEWGTGEYFDKKCDPIAWMPLPEPYKGVTE